MVEDQESPGVPLAPSLNGHGILIPTLLDMVPG